MRKLRRRRARRQPESQRRCRRLQSRALTAGEQVKVVCLDPLPLPLIESEDRSVVQRVCAESGAPAYWVSPLAAALARPVDRCRQRCTHEQAVSHKGRLFGTSLVGPDV